MKKIAFFTLGLRRGGAERVVSNLCNSLVEDYKVYLILVDNQIDYDLDKRVVVKKLAPVGDVNNGVLKVMLLPFYAIYLWRFLSKEKINTIFSFLLRPNFISCLVKKIKGRRVDVVISERSNPLAQYSSDSISNMLNRFLIRRLYPIADSVTVNSYGSAHVLSEHYKISTRIEVIRNPITSNFFNNSKGKVLDKDCFRFITVGRLDEGKNHMLLLKAIKDLTSSSKKNIELSIIGEGVLRPKLERFCKENKIENYVKFLGYRNNVEEYLQKSDCFIFVSKREGFPNVIIEAMASMLPVISTDCPYGPREILLGSNALPNGKLDSIEVMRSGILIPVNRVDITVDAMKYLMLNYDAFMKNIEVNKELLKQYNIDSVIDQYNTLFLRNK